MKLATVKAELAQYKSVRAKLRTTDLEQENDRLADDMYERSEPDYLIYNAPLEYADLILNGNPEKYLKNISHWEILSVV